jgi:hypothetical protein
MFGLVGFGSRKTLFGIVICTVPGSGTGTAYEILYLKIFFFNFKISEVQLFFWIYAIRNIITTMVSYL